MSTKSTIAYGKDFHFYHEALDEDNVYLELENVEFEAGCRRMTVRIPVDIWEVIRHTAPARLDLVDCSDEELRRVVESQVGERVAEYERARGDSRKEAVISFCGSLVFGGADEPREEQVRRGLAYYIRDRERQRGIVARMKEHKVTPEETLYELGLGGPEGSA